jgi:hypothetical protein
MKELAKKMSEAISTERERRFIADEAALEAVLRENGWCKQSEVIYDHHGQVACYTFGCTEADKVRKEAVTKTLSDIKRQIHEKAIYPHNAGIKPYISVREVDEIIEKEISHTKGGG